MSTTTEKKVARITRNREYSTARSIANQITANGDSNVSATIYPCGCMEIHVNGRNASFAECSDCTAFHARNV